MERKIVLRGVRRGLTKRTPAAYCANGAVTDKN